MPDRPVRIQRSRAPGWRMPENTVYVGRPSEWGNPFRVGEPCDRAQIKRWGWQFRHPDFVCKDVEIAYRRFRACLLTDEAIHEHVRAELRGKNLACWCPLPEPGKPDCCHAAVLLDIANAEPHP